jgi:hypothetical protein
MMHDWIARHGLSGPVVTLGVQDVSFTRDDFGRWLSPEFPRPASPRLMTADELFRGLGLGVPTSVDVSNYEGAQVLFDLNSKDLPGPLWSAFNLVFNGGTLEHVFDVPNALASMSRMLRPGGAVLHVFPVNNWVDHGFYQFSPTLAYDYYAAAGFETLESALAAFHQRPQQESIWEVNAAPPGLLGSGSAGGLDDRTYLHLFLTRRGEQVVDRPVPMQTMYAPGRPQVLPPRWFPSFELRDGTRVERPNRHVSSLRRFQRESGLAWSAALPELQQWGDDPDRPSVSRLVLLEDERPLGPAHATHEIIRQHGGGRYSHWRDRIYLSTRDGSDPNHNGRSYVAVLPGL